MNQYLKNLRKIEFVVTMACTGRCRHCSEGDHDGCFEHIDAAAASDAVRKICSCYDISAVMTFGGEPLLYPDTVCAIHKTARDLGVAKRQVITNGFFSKNKDRIKAVAHDLAESGVNDLLLSADAFHQEAIPLDTVMFFAECAVDAGLPVRLQPAWLVSAEAENPYNEKTKEIIRAFEPLHIPQNQGNVIFPSGNALKYLREYFDDNAVPFSPYEEDPEDIRTISFDPNGDVLNGNVYKTDILELIRTYRPKGNGSFAEPSEVPTTSDPRRNKHMKLSVIFEDKPQRWGFRGDPYFWDYLKERAENMDLITPEELEEWIKAEYLSLSGKVLTDEYMDFAVIKQFAHGGMSSGGVDNIWWMEEGIPLLKSRLAAL